jgi:hypothetical protein
VGLNEKYDDPDDDGLSNSSEYYYRTEPLISDTDGDGYSDGEEIILGTDPCDPNSVILTAFPI